MCCGELGQAFNTYVGIHRAGLDACGLQCNIDLLFQENQRSSLVCFTYVELIVFLYIWWEMAFDLILFESLHNTHLVGNGYFFLFQGLRFIFLVNS